MLDPTADESTLVPDADCTVWEAVAAGAVVDVDGSVGVAVVDGTGADGAVTLGT